MQLQKLSLFVDFTHFKFTDTGGHSVEILFHLHLIFTFNIYIFTHLELYINSLQFAPMHMEILSLILIDVTIS